MQGRANVEALNVLFPLRRVMAYDMVPDAAWRYAEEVSARFDLEVVVAGTPRQAVTGCDMVVTAGPILKVPHATIQAGWLDAGAVASLVDYDSYWHRGALIEADKFCTDDLPQLGYYQQAGYFQGIPPVYAEVGELVAGRKPGRTSRTERTMTANLGIAMDDMAVAPLVYRRAVDKGVGTWLEL